jgi:hypothetical protein
MKRRQLTPKVLKAWRWFLLTFNTDQRFLQRFKATHEPLVKALSSFENMESHGEPIKPVLRQLITWTSLKKGITLLEFFGGIGTGFEALL